MSYCGYLMKEYFGLTEMSREVLDRATAKVVTLYNDPDDPDEETHTNIPFLRAAYNLRGKKDLDPNERKKHLSGDKTHARQYLDKHKTEPNPAYSPKKTADVENQKEYFRSFMQKKKDAEKHMQNNTSSNIKTRDSAKKIKDRITMRKKEYDDETSKSYQSYSLAQKHLNGDRDTIIDGGREEDSRNMAKKGVKIKRPLIKNSTAYWDYYREKTGTPVKSIPKELRPRRLLPTTEEPKG